MSQFNTSKDVEIRAMMIDGTYLTTYKAKVRDLNLKSISWLPNELKIPDRHYFEIQILSIGASRKISLGVIDEINRRFEYQADGKIYYNGKYISSEIEARFDQKNAIVGCGIDFTEQRLFFVLPDGTKRFLPSNKRTNPFVSLVPFVTLSNKGEHIAVNFGERKFAHDPFGENSTIPTHFVKQKDIKFEVEDSNIISINCNDKIRYRSLQANRNFARSDPTTIPYFEVKIIKADAHVMIGYSDTLFNTYNSIGNMQNAVGWIDQNQTCDHLTNHSGATLLQTSGDIFGCGIIMDSYNTHRIFLTKNGKWIGFVAGRKVNDGMDCFPTISFLGSATISYNFGASKFSWDVKNAPKFQRTAGINAVPLELLQIIFEYASHSEAFALISMSVVNKKWRQIMLGLDPVWRRLYYKKFPNQNPDLKVKNWYKFFTRRVQATKSVSDPHPIENCSLVFECPMILENFKNVKDTDTKVFCDKCQKDVHIVETIGQLKQQASLGLCVAWREKSESDNIDWLGGYYCDDDM